MAFCTEVYQSADFLLGVAGGVEAEAAAELMMQDEAGRSATYTLPCDDRVHVVEFSPYDCGVASSLLAYAENQCVVVGSCRFKVSSVGDDATQRDCPVRDQLLIESFKGERVPGVYSSQCTFLLGNEFKCKLHENLNLHI